MVMRAVAVALALAATWLAPAAARAGSGDGRTYRLTWIGADQAGNTAACTATVRVPHARP
jgi:hypothetical protein